MTTPIKYALKYHALGWYPIPCCWPTAQGACGCGASPPHTGKDIGKAPLLGANYQNLTPTRADVEAWWRRWPHANIAILLAPSGLIVVDPDSPEAVAEVEALGVPPTASCATGKGAHYYFRRPEGVEARRKLKSGTSKALDILGRGYVMAPPSRHANGKTYTWTSPKGLQPQQPPQWVLDAIAPPAPPPAPAALPTPSKLSARWKIDDEQRDWQLAVEALRAIPADTYLDEWLAVGMGLHSKWPSAGLDLWDSWSRTGGEKYHQGECARRWATFRARGTQRNLATVFEIAKRYGWRFPERDEVVFIDRRPPPPTDADAPAWVANEDSGADGPTQGSEDAGAGAGAPPDEPPWARVIPLRAQPPNAEQANDDGDDETCFFVEGFDRAIRVDFEAEAQARAAQEEIAKQQREQARAEREAKRAEAKEAAGLLYDELVVIIEEAERAERKSLVFGFSKDARLVTACAADPGGFADFLLRLDNFPGCTKSRIELLARVVRTGAEALREPERRADVDELEIPVQGLTIPTGYAISARGIAKTVTLKDASGAAAVGSVLITQAPILVLGRSEDVHAGAQSVRVGWRVGQEWTLRDVPRDQIASGRHIVELAKWGAPVTSQNAGELVEFLARQEAANLADLPRERTSARLGWQRGGFLWGQEFISQDGAPLAFRPVEAGDAQIARACRRRGTLAGWVEAAQGLAPYPVAACFLYASLAACLLELTDADNCILDVACPTSSGKSIALTFAGSAWGCANERDSEGTLFQKWNSKPTFIERLIALTSGMPLILDDTKQAPSPDHIAQTLYAVASGRGKGRGTTQGIAETTAAKTILLSTSESPAINATRDGGTRARTLTLWALPFGSTAKEMRPIVQGLADAANDHYGHAGPALVAYLDANRHAWPEWRAHYRARREALAKTAEDDSVKGRLAGHVALLELAGQLAAKALGLNLPVAEHMAHIWPMIGAESSDAAGAAGAMVQLWGWIGANSHSFYSPTRPAATPPLGGWLGALGAEDGLVLLYPHVLDNFLDKQGYGREMMRLWRDKGWLRVDKDRDRFQTRRRVAGQRGYFVALNTDQIEADLEIDEVSLSDKQAG